MLRPWYGLSTTKPTSRSGSAALAPRHQQAGRGPDAVRRLPVPVAGDKHDSLFRGRPRGPPLMQCAAVTSRSRPGLATTLAVQKWLPLASCTNSAPTARGGRGRARAGVCAGRGARPGAAPTAAPRADGPGPRRRARQRGHDDARQARRASPPSTRPPGPATPGRRRRRVSFSPHSLPDMRDHPGRQPTDGQILAAERIWRDFPVSGEQASKSQKAVHGREQPAYLDRTGIAEEVTGSAPGPPDGAACPRAGPSQ